MKLTTTTIRALSLPRGKSEAITFDTDVPGFGVRIRAGGSKGYVFQYKIGNKQRRMALGPVTAIDIGKARDTAKDLYARVRLGDDPAGEKIDAKVKAAETLEAAITLYLTRQKTRLKPRSLVEVQRHLLVHAKPLHGLQLAKIERRTIATLLSRIADESGAVTANRVRASLSALASWAIQQGMLEFNPVSGTSREPEKTRDRVLTPTEMKLIWCNLDADHFGSIVRLLMLTACRANEIASLRWSEIHDEMIVLPSERTKNGRSHIVPLTQPARAIIAALPKRADRDFVFGVGEGAFTGWGRCRERLNERIAKAARKPLPHWTPHDIRRSVATHLAELGTAPHVIESVLNHIGHRQGVSGVYNRSTYQREVTTALQRWADQLLAWVEGRDTNVVPLRQA
jgi:integrase